MLEGIIRESIGRKAAKALKRDGYLIANIYAKGFENIHAAFKLNDFIKEVRKKTTLAFDIKVGEKVLNVVIVDYQKDPVTAELKHVDLKVAQKGVVSKYMIPVKIIGTAIGLKNKGVLIQSKRRLKVKCKAENLPNFFELDVSKLDVGDALLVKDVVVPEGVSIIDAERVAVVGVEKAR
ncbi:50S ribosomal protein L25/general stress protein Ctc [Campylobacter novaezeelandiae]|uniref:Large ribosomal subunit protein bL25 n=1 Tax=Campylobacter novaezeelandiae TaxID=2267891 RepID=A0A4Q9JVG8_9BACT|nr:50S ribosomal protein L25/general stress protein Ctc [Campylobacter novaezeelandiae]QWU80660.1 50S ribosomal protein L25 [Campylobacter novaezeelandiae]TBR78373.1 50S ribosomal protein L25/general stress protein Ctc [Campylobacter novaezeelandiae]TBR79711.1 50S ribosomal protein L25/general stress protein Ctc [Campylobacter novaezeelandiae]TBR80315.1 50S ribosomal protein L25/general stress protein Ctc [Campylobacter novaezeelandiae]TBR80660.1 50S ribosomal protein L25/general stress protei